MQQLARDGMSADEVREIITGDAVDASVYGCEVLDLEGKLLGELSDSKSAERLGEVIGGGGDLVGCTVSRDIELPVPGTVKLSIGRTLDWRNVRVRPWQELNGIRFYLGLYGLETPTATPSEGIVEVRGYDVLAAFRVVMRRSHWLETGLSYTAAMRDWIERMAIPGITHRIASDADAVLTDVRRCWALNAASPDLELDGINDLAAAVGYTPLHTDELGALVSMPYRPPVERPSEWTYNLNETIEGRKLSITDVTYTATRQVLGEANWWRGVRRDLLSRPAEGSGIYTVDRSDGGRIVPSWGTYDVATQDALEALVDARIVKDTTSRLTVEITTDAMPFLGHGDIVTLVADQINVNGRAQITKYDMDLAKAEVKQTLGVL